MGGLSRPSHGHHALWFVETDPGSPSMDRATLSALSSALSTRRRRALPHGEFGLEVIALIGRWRFREHRSVPEMHRLLLARGMSITERSVTHLMQRYEELVTLRITDHERVKTQLQKQGHVMLALDGLQPDVGHEVLWVVRDCLSEEILLARPLLSSTQGDLTALLTEVKDLLK